MTVRCAVRGCKSGLVSDKQQKIRAGLKPATLFTVPKTSDLLSQWSAALHQELQHNEKVCELHFAEEDVIKSDDTILPDGSIFSLPRNKYLLRKNAVPKDIFEQESSPLEKKDPVITQSIQKDSGTENVNVVVEQLPSNDSLIGLTSMDVEEVLINNGMSDTLHNNFENDSPIMEVLNDSILNESLSNDHQYFVDKTKPDQYYYFNNRVAAMFAIPMLNNFFDKEKKQLPESNENAQAAIVENDNNKSTEENTQQVIDSNLGEMPPSPQVFCEASSEITLESIKDFIFKNPLPKCWSWMHFTSMDNGITFAQIDCTTKKIRCFIQLYEDMTTSIQTGDEEVCMEIKYDFLSPECILTLLEKVEKIKICTGAENGSRDKCCTGVIPEEEDHNMSTMHVRCMACRKLRVRFRNRYEYANHLKIKYHQLKKELSLLKRKCKNYEKKEQREK